MKIFHSPDHSLHAPAWYLADGTIYPCPETPARVNAILTALQSNNTHELIAIPPIKNQKSKIKNLHPSILAIHTSDYLHYLQFIHEIWAAEFGPNTNVLPDTFPPRTPHQIKPPEKPSAQVGYYCFDTAAPITAGTFTAALASAHTALTAADFLLQKETAAYALCRPPGHHAGPNYAGGFCFLNNAAIAAQHLLSAGMKRIALLDVDYHHGNGTQDIFYHRRDVLFLSLHADPNTQYPYFWGHANETGAGKGKNFTANFPLPRNCPEKKWFHTLTRATTRIQAYKPDALLISLGVDTAHNDTVGDFHLSPASFKKLGHHLRQLNLPTLFLQEGGYHLNQIGPAVDAVLQGFES